MATIADSIVSQMATRHGTTPFAVEYSARYSPLYVADLGDDPASAIGSVAGAASDELEVIIAPVDQVYERDAKAAVNET